MQSKLGPSPASSCCIQPPRIHAADAVHAAAMCVLCLRPEDITSAEVIVFPGVGSFGSAMEVSCHSRVPCSGPSHPLHEHLAVDAHQCVLCQVISSSPTTSALYMGAGGDPLPRAPPSRGGSSVEFLAAGTDSFPTSSCWNQVLDSKGYTPVLRDYLRADRPFFGICLGMQTLFEGSEECPGVPVRAVVWYHGMLMWINKVELLVLWTCHTVSGSVTSLGMCRSWFEWHTGPGHHPRHREEVRRLPGRSTAVSHTLPCRLEPDSYSATRTVRMRSFEGTSSSTASFVALSGSRCTGNRACRCRTSGGTAC